MFSREIPFFVPDRCVPEVHEEDYDTLDAEARMESSWYNRVLVQRSDLTSDFEDPECSSYTEDLDSDLEFGLNDETNGD